MFKAIRNALIDRALATNTGRKAAMRAAAAMGNGIVYRNFGDHKLAIDSSELIGRSILKQGHFSREILDTTVDFLTSAGALPPNGAFIDVGANIGTHSVYASLTGRFSQLVCIEPDPANYELLTANIALNGLTSRTHLVNAGAGEQEGELHLYRVDQNSGASTLVTPSNHRSAPAAIVRVRRLDDVLAGLDISGDRVGLVWMDTEGFEPSIWKGMPQLLAAKPNIVLEFSPRIYGADVTRAFCIELFACYDRVKMLDAGGIVDCTPGTLAAVTDQVDILLMAAPRQS